MKKLIYILLLWAVSLYGQFKLPAYEKVELDNGLTVYLMEQHEVPVISITALFSAGAVSDGEKNGLASITSEALLAGTKNYTKDQIEELFDFHGASLSANANLEFSTLNTSFNAKDSEKLLPVFAEIVTSPLFPENEVEKKKTIRLSELDQMRESPRNVIWNYFNSFVYQGSTYGNPVSGLKSTVSKISAGDVKEFYTKYYLPVTSAIAVAGDFNTEEMKQKLTQLLGKWENSSTPDSRTVPDVMPVMKKDRVLIVNKEDAFETTFLIGGLGMKRSNPDYIKATVVNTILGGRFTSWLNDELRVNSGLTYGARSMFVPYKYAGSFAMSSFTRTETTFEALDLAVKVYDKLLKQGIDQATLESAKNYIKGQFPPRYETSGSLANLMTQMYFYGFDESYINNFEENVDKLTIDETKRIVEQYFPKENIQFILIGKASELKEKAAKYGEITEKEIKNDSY